MTFLLWLLLALYMLTGVSSTLEALMLISWPVWGPLLFVVWVAAAVIDQRR